GRGAIGQIGMVLALGLQMSQRLLCLLEDILPPVEQLLAEILPLALIHEGLLVGGAIALPGWSVIFCARASFCDMPVLGSMSVCPGAHGLYDLNDPSGSAGLFLATCSLAHTHSYPRAKVRRDPWFARRLYSDRRNW